MKKFIIAACVGIMFAACGSKQETKTVEEQALAYAEQMEQAIQAGDTATVKSLAEEMTAFLNPSEDSYRRFGVDKAPAFVSWSRENRSHLIRIPADPSGNRRIELRSPDAGANPYLSFALLIYAGLQGIAEQLELPDTMEINLYKADRSVTDKLEQLPGTREEAAKLAAGSDFVRRFVPAACLEAYINEKEI